MIEMRKTDLPTVKIEQRKQAPAVTPQALAWDGKYFWMSSRDLGTLLKIDADAWRIVDEFDPPGVIWAGVSTNDGLRLTIGKGLNDDRYVYYFSPNEGFRKLFACPDFAGSYLSFDGEHCYLSQWYKGQIHQVDDSGKISQTIETGAEVCGHTFVDGRLYVLRGRENKDVPRKSEEWRIARLDDREQSSEIYDLATVPFAARSLTHDGKNFWSNHRAANETISFNLRA